MGRTNYEEDTAIDELIERLLDCAAIRDAQRRELIVDRLPQVRAVIARSPVAKADVAAIVGVCAEHRALDDLLAAVRFFESGSVAMQALDDWRADWDGSYARADRETAARAPGSLWRVPALPPHFLARPEPLQQVVACLCGNGRAGKYGLHGMGGIGKTALATAVARSQEIRARFTDGVYWLTVGRSPRLTVLQADLADALGIDGVFRGPADGKHKLTAALAGKLALLVLDDVWEAEHAAALEVVDDGGGVLITTRNLDVLTWRAARVHELALMTSEQARSLLAGWNDVALDALSADATEVAEACGRLPLALAIAGALVRKPGGSWARVLRLVQSAKLDKLRGRMPAYPYRNVYQAIAASVAQLVADDIADHAEQCYADLAVFADDDVIPVSALYALWGRYGLDVDDVHDLASALASYSLAAVAGEEPLCLRLHDIQRAYTRACHGDVAALHGALVDAYAETCPDGDLARGPADAGARGYFYSRLPYHLAAAGRAQEVPDSLGRYAWLDGKLRACGVAELLADFERLQADSDEPGLALIGDALRLSSHVLARDASQLPGQLVGRLGWSLDDVATASASVRTLLAAARTEPAQPWLCPTFASLTAPGGPLLRTFEGHSDSIDAVALSADGERALSGSADGTAKLWDTGAGTLLRTFAGHTDWVTAVALSGDGKRVLSGSADGTVRLWDADTGTSLHRLIGHLDLVRAVALSGDGRRALSGSDDRTLKLWDTATGTLLRTFQGHADSVRAVALGEDGKRALSGCKDGTLGFWDLETGARRAAPGHRDWINSVSLSADGTRAVSGSRDRTLVLWDVDTGARLMTFEGHADAVCSSVFSSDGKRVLSGSRDRTLALWDTDTGTRLRTFEGHTDAVWSVALSAAGTRALSGSEDRTLAFWDTEKSAPRARYAGHARTVWSVALGAHGTRILSGSEDCTLALRDTETGSLLRALEGHESAVLAVAVSADGKRAVSGSSAGALGLWDIENGRLLRRFEAHSDRLNAIALSADGTRALSGSEDGTLKLWCPDTQTLVRTFERHWSPIEAVALSADGARALSCSHGRVVDVWDVVAGTRSFALEHHRGRVRGVALSANGERAVSGSTDGCVHVWDAGRGVLLRTMKRYPESVHAVAASADGTRALSGSESGRLTLWDIDRGQHIASFSADAPIRSCSLSTSYQLIVGAGDQSGRIYVLRLHTRE